MTPQDIKNKRVDFLKEVIFKYRTTTPELNYDELAFAICWHLDGEELLKSLKALHREIKAKW